MNATEPSNYLILLSTVALIIVSTIFVLFSFKKRLSKEEEEPLTLELDSSGWDEVSSPSSSSSPPPPSLRESVSSYDGKTQISDGKTTATDARCSQKKTSDENDEIPFNSSYYYAHNHLKKTGGYKDGLRAEDYQMNEPKLLSKTSSELDSRDYSKQTFFIKNGIRINRYLWDDNDSNDGIARIIIDSIPSDGTSSSAMIKIADTGLRKEDVKCKLLGAWKNGLMVQIRHFESKYFLFIPRMYGEVEDVKPVFKAKKIIIKLIKKRNADNLKVWPQLPSNLKVPASATDEFEDLFATENS